MKLFDLFYKKTGAEKTEYAGSLWEGRFADDQKAKGNEPWLDVNLSKVINGKREYATAIIYGGKHKLTLGKEAGVFLKAGVVEGHGVRPIGGATPSQNETLETADEVDDVLPAAEEPTEALDLSELA